MLYLYQSNRLEYLAEMMSAIQSAQPLNSVLAQEEIVVQSQGMRRFINRFLAQQQSIAANIRFSLPAGLSWQLMREHLPDTPELNPFSTEVVRWRLFALFQSSGFAHSPDLQHARAELGSFTDGGEYTSYQLAGQLADMFDQYLVYRPDWIEAWQQQQLAPDVPQEQQLWQAELWRYLDQGTGTPHRVAMWKQLMAALASPDTKLAQRYFVFGIASMAPMYLSLLQAIAKHRDVHIFALNPSSAYWGNVLEPAQILASDNDIDLSEQGHPLLASLGKQGRDFFDALTEAEVEREDSVYDQPAESDSLLHTLQYHIQEQILPEHDHENWLTRVGTDRENVLQHLRLHDHSVQIHSAHSPLRELQILKDRICQWLHEHPDWQPHDIAVLTPNIEAYAPFIEAVFGNAQHGGQALPYSLTDVRLARKQPLLDALDQVLTLLDSRFEIDKLIALLDSETVLARFGLNRHDLPLIHDTLLQLNIRWGADQAHRRDYSHEHSHDALFTWQQGLQRLLLGWALPEQQGLWQNTAAWHGNPAYLDVFSRLAAVLQILIDTRREWQQPADIATWVQRVRTLRDSLLHASDSDRNALQQLEQALSRWQQESALAQSVSPSVQAVLLSSQTAIQHVRNMLGASSEAGFLRQGITFCGMVPMRSLPFKAICLIGLNDGDFPRNTKAASFDLIARYPRKGDRARRDDDRYLFLETLLSARQKLYLSFVGRDIRSNEERAPSTLLGELIDNVAALSGIAAQTLREQWLIHHPLQAFSRQNFRGDDLLFSSRADFAHALNEPQSVRPFVGTEALAAPDGERIIEQDAFIAFWRNPIRHWLRNHFNWQKPFHNEQLPSDEPFDDTQARSLADAYLQARREHGDFGEQSRILAAQNHLPAGELGHVISNKFAAQAKSVDAAQLSGTPLPERHGLLHGQLRYRIDKQFDSGQLFHADRFLAAYTQNHKPNSGDKIALLLHHLIFNAAMPEHEGERSTHFIGIGQHLTLPPLPQSQAAHTLERWIDAYRAGQMQALPFLPRTTLAAAGAYFKKPAEPDWQAAMTAARSKYHGSNQSIGEADSEELRLLLRHQDEALYERDAFEQLTKSLFDGLGEVLAVLATKEQK